MNESGTAVPHSTTFRDLARNQLITRFHSSFGIPLALVAALIAALAPRWFRERCAAARVSFAATRPNVVASAFLILAAAAHSGLTFVAFLRHKSPFAKNSMFADLRFENLRRG